MKTKWRILFIVFAIFFLPSPLHASEPMSEKQADEIVIRHLKKNLASGGLSLDCVFLMTEASTASFYEIAVREKHGGHCGGDPAVSPIVDRYRVLKARGKLKRYDVVQDAWVN